MVSHSHVAVRNQSGGQITAPCAVVAADPVLAAAYTALVSFGPNRMTLTDVARRAGVSRMTVYRRYETLPRLVSAVLTAELVDLLGTAKASVREGSDAEQIAALVTDAAQRIAEHPVMTRLLTVEPEALLPVIVRRRGSTQTAAERLLAETIAQADDGSVRVQDADAAATALVTAASGFVFTSAQAGQPSGWEQLQRIALGYLRQGDR